jgi:uncharacterized ferritin-like protein (DUF455 family)
MIASSPSCLRRLALQWLAMPDFHDKARLLEGLDIRSCALDPCLALNPPPDLPGRPARPALVAPQALKQRAVGTPAGHASLIHALTHIEANAINLALDMVWRFAGQPALFYLQWMQVAREEALHFRLLAAHLQTLGMRYGDLPAHNGLWEMAERTQNDLLARLALVPRTLEARGLDVTPAIRTKLVSIGDQAGAAILDIILRDEIGHVAVGNHWSRQQCQQQGLDPVTAYADLAKRYRAPALKGPFNLEARRQAGFDDVELMALSA